MIPIAANENHSIVYSRWFTWSGGGGCGSTGAPAGGVGVSDWASIQRGSSR